jgi:O-acetyl-ADP-ribose deacetylase (regulator of RNase III)
MLKLDVVCPLCRADDEIDAVLAGLAAMKLSPCDSAKAGAYLCGRAAEIATATVKEWLENDDRIKKVIFNVFKDEDLRIYKEILG